MFKPFTRILLIAALVVLAVFNFQDTSAQANCATIDWTFTPAPVNNTYTPGDVVHVCIHLSYYNQTGSNWLHGIVLDFPAGWDISSITNISTPPSCVGTSTADWDYYTSCTATGTGQTFGPGFYYDTSSGGFGVYDGNPGNNWGDLCTNFPSDFTFCFDITIRPNCGGAGNPLDGNSLTPAVDITGDGLSGSYFSPNASCATSHHVANNGNSNITIEDVTINCCDSESGISPGTVSICETGTYNLFDILGPPVDAGGYWTYSGTGSYTDPSGAAGLGTFDPTVDPPGDYTYHAGGSGGCESTTTITMEYIDYGILTPAITFCSTALLDLDSTLTEPPIGFPFISGGTWYFDYGGGGQTAVPAGVLDPDIDPAGIYTYEFYDPASCKSTVSLDIVFSPAASAGCATTVDVCTSDPCFSPINALGCNPADGGTWLVWDPAHTQFLGYYANSSVCIDMDSLTTAQNYYGDMNFQYLLGAGNCAPALTDLTVNVYLPANTGLNTQTSICVNDVPLDLTDLLDGNPDYGLDWTDLGNAGASISNIFDPGSVAPNTTLNYQYSGGLAGTTCQSSTLLELTVLPAYAYAGEDNTITVCESDPPFYMTDSLPDNPLNGDSPQTGGTWTDPNGIDNGAYFAPGTSTPGDYNYNITSTCATDDATLTINVLPTPVPGTSGTLDICDNETNVQLSDGLGAPFDAGGQWSLGGSNVGPTVDGNTVTDGDVYTYTVGTAPCQLSSTVTINLSNAPTAGLLTSNPQNYCDSDGSIDLMSLFTTNPSDINPAYWSGPGTITLGTIDPSLGASQSGLYTYTIPDAGCGPASVSINITIEDTPDAGTDASLTACPNGTGTIDLLQALGNPTPPPAGGTWTAPPGGPTNGTFNPGNGDPAGDYIYELSSPSGNCTDQATVTVQYQTLAFPGNDLTITVCAGDPAFNMIDVMAPGAVEGTWSGATATPGVFDPAVDAQGSFTNSVISGICPPVSATLTINVTPIPNAGTNATASFCENMGSVDLTSNLGGNPDTGGTWTDGSGNPVSSPYDITGLCGNTFTFTYTVGSGTCSSSADLTFDVICLPNAGNNGTINTCSTGATFSLFDGLNGTYDTGGTWVNSSGTDVTGQAANMDPATLGTGDTFTYTVTATPCSPASADVVVNITPAMTAANVDAACTPSQTTYIVTFDISGGQPPYSIAGGDPGTVSGSTYTSAPIAAGTPYSVDISDGSSCTDLNVSGVSPNCFCPVTAAFASGDQTICIGSSADIELDLNGGTPGTYIVDYNDGSGPTSLTGQSDGDMITVSPTSTTTYTLTNVTDGNCIGSVSGSVTITVESLPDAGADHSDDYCGDGSVLVLTPAAGEPTGGTFNPTQITLDPANAGVYPYTVAGNVCPDDLANYTVNVDPQLTATGVQANCTPAQTDYTVTFTISGGTGTGTYTVDGVAIPGNTFTSTTISLPDPTGYTFSVDDGGPCGPITVSGSAPNCSCPITAAFASGNQTICIGSSANIELDLNGGTDGTYVADYDDGSGTTSLTGLSDGDMITVSPTSTTTYTLTSVTDGNCIGSVSGSVTITVESLPDAGADHSDDYCGDGSVLVLTPAAGEPAGGAFTPTQITLDPANAGVYPYTVAGNQCPDDVADYTINIDPQLTATGVQANCSPAQTDYTVTFTISGGSGSGTYTVDGIAIPGNTFTSTAITLPDPTGYSFSVDDGGPCGPITVSGSAPNCSCPVIAAFASGNQTICIGSSANIELDLNGGTDGTYVADYDDGSGTTSLTGLSDGDMITVSPTSTTTYTLTNVADGNCTGSVSGSVTITVESLPDAGADHSDDYCGDGSVLVLTPAAGEPAGGTFTPTQITLDPANSGVYPYTVAGNVCPDDVADYTININEELTVSNISAVCDPNQTEYTVEFTINGGTPPYTVNGTIISGTDYSETLNFAANPTYDFTIADNSSCADVSVSGIAPDCNCIAQGSISGSNTICLGECTNITFDLIGDGPFNVSYQNGNSGQITTLTGIDNGHVVSVCPTVSNTYTLISVSDTYCSGTVTGQPVDVTVNNPFTISNVTEICDNTGENYQVQFTITGGIPPYNFAGQNNTSPNPNTFLSNPIPSGTGYNITVSDAGVCPSQEVSNPVHTCVCISDAGSIPSTPLEVCDGGTLSISTNGTETLDGNDIIQYILHDGSADNIGNIIATSPDGNFTFNYSGMEPGAVYYINAVVGNNSGNGNVDLNDDCTSISNGTSLIMNPLPTATISGGTTVCPGEPVELMVTFTGEGPWDFSYTVDGDPQSQPNFSSTDEFTFTSTQPGDYTITSVSDNNCSGTGSGTATIQNFVTPTATLSGNPTVCEGSGDGPEVTLDGDGPWTFVYSIDGVDQPPVTTNFPTYTIPAEVGGTYALVSLEGSNCTGTVSGSQNISLLEAPTATITGGGTVCAGDSATFDVGLTGTAPWTVNYTVDGVPQSPLTNINNNYSFESSIDGDYVIVSVNDANCPGDVLASQAELNVNPLPTANITASKNSVCIGEEVDLGIDLEGVPPYTVTYVLNNDTMTTTGLYSDFIQTLEPESPVTLEVLYVEDGSDPTCSSEPNSYTYIDATVLPNAPVLANDTVCEDNGLVRIGTSPAPGLTYSWSPEENLSDPHSPNPMFTPTTNGPVATSYKYVLTATNGSCSASDTMHITVDPGPMARFTFSPNPVKNVDPTVHFTNNSIARDQTAYFWVFDTLGTSTELDPTFKFPDEVNTNYTVELTAIDPSTGCMDSYSDVVNIKPEMLIYVPNAFTPDGDGLNDLWGPVLSNIDPNEYKLTIFDRFGQVVFTTHDIDQKWNGGMNGGSYYVKEGVYIWMIETKNEISLEEVKMKGSVTVVR